MKKDIKFDLMAPFYDGLMYFFNNETEDILDLVGKEDEKILDVGGGTGRIAERLTDEKRKVFILDLNKKMLSKALEKGLELIIQGDAKKMPFQESKFDTIICSDAYHHLLDKDRVLEEFDRVLKPDGTIIVFDFSPKSMITQLLKRFESIIGKPVEFVDSDKLKEDLNSNGYEVEIDDKGNFKYIIKAENGQ